MTSLPSALAGALLTLILTPAAGIAQAAVGSQTDGPQTEVAAGIAAFDARDPAGAIRHFERALSADSTSYEANWRAALALITLGLATPDSVRSAGRDSLYHRAEQDARRAVRSDSLGAEGHFILARAIGQTALTKGTQERVRLAAEVREEALRALALDSRHDGAYHVLGRWNAEIMRLSGVSRFVARQFLGGRVFGQASWEGAISNLERAVALDSTRIIHRLDLARVYVDRKRFADARRQLEALEALPIRDFNDPMYKDEAAALLRKIGSGGNNS